MPAQREDAAGGMQIENKLASLGELPLGITAHNFSIFLHNFATGPGAQTFASRRSVCQNERRIDQAFASNLNKFTQGDGTKSTSNQ